MKILRLTLAKGPFEVMITGEKNYEIREPSAWILSRLYDHEGNKKDYDAVEFTNGYSMGSPYFLAKFKGFETVSKMDITFSNGFHLKFDGEQIKINLGEILEIGNYRKEH